MNPWPWFCPPETVEEIEGALGGDLYPSLAEERLHWERELKALRDEKESLTAVLCSKEDDLNRTKATVSAVREERDRLRRRVRRSGMCCRATAASRLRHAAAFIENRRPSV